MFILFVVIVSLIGAHTGLPFTWGQWWLLVGAGLCIDCYNWGGRQ